jgi:hypothetical protein
MLRAMAQIEAAGCAIESRAGAGRIALG